MNIELARFENLQPHQQRVVVEHQELCEKIDKLSAFLVSPTFLALEGAERLLLHEQHCHMRRYRDVLEHRIANFI